MGAFRNPSVEPVGAWRRWLVVAVLGAGALTVLARAAQLQVVERDVLVERGDRRALRTLRIQAHRGAVLDRNGEPLALSAPADSIWAVPSKLLEASAYHEPIARLLNISPAELRERLAERPDAQFIYLRRLLSPDVADRVLALGAPGVSRENGFRRYYPAGEVAAHVVGLPAPTATGSRAWRQRQTRCCAAHPAAGAWCVRVTAASSTTAWVPCRRCPAPTCD